MDTDGMRTCPYCAESIRAEAIKCRYCGSIVSGASPTPQSYDHWARVPEGKRIAGVCTGLAREFGTPQLVLPLRLAFILTTIFAGFGLITYLALWVLMPSAPAQAQARVSATNLDRDMPYDHPQPRGTGDRGDNLAGILLIGIGIAIIALILGYHFLPIFGHPRWVPFAAPFAPPSHYSVHFFPGFLPMLILCLFLLLFFGVFRLFKVALGCAATLVAILVMLVLMPFFALAMVGVIPLLLLIPLAIVIGVIMIVIGGIKLLVG